jgi:hypothetical protein
VIVPKEVGDRRTRLIIMESENRVRVRHSKRAENLVDDGHDDKKAMLFGWRAVR